MIYLVRHGQTDLNGRHALQGRSDMPLNNAGVRQVQEVGRQLAHLGITFSKVYSSPLQRAIQTAEIIAPNVPVGIDDRLIEMDYGPYEGMDLRNPAPEIVTFFKDFVNNPAPKGMEQLSEVVARVGAFIDELTNEPGNILITTHAIALKGVLEHLTPESRGSYWSRYLGNCAVYVADNSGGRIGKPREVFGEPSKR